MNGESSEGESESDEGMEDVEKVKRGEVIQNIDSILKSIDESDHESLFYFREHFRQFRHLIALELNLTQTKISDYFKKL